MSVFQFSMYSIELQMDSEASQQPKQERSRTRWTASLDKIFADLVVKQIQLGNRPNNVFDKKTWNHIRDEFNRQTDLKFNNNQLRKHLDVLRQRFNILKSAHDQSDFAIEDSCCIGFDLWEDIGMQPRPETVKIKDCPIYDQLCAIFADTSADGKYAQSSHFEGLDKSVGNHTSGIGPCSDGLTAVLEDSSSKIGQTTTALSEKLTKNMADKKRKRPCETHSSMGQSRMEQETVEAMAEALFEMVAALKSRAVGIRQIDDRFSISNCIKALDEIEYVEEELYFAALDLFEDPNLRETFISLKGDKLRLAWLQGKCSKSI
ncbi:L10-interacting MYB domain-containing protein-like isoform X1 [Carica papaya]|uniref:L10-interacting MYB domain-containing protein-like isoform X1 n=3 Tax=Carica papaya TaxID=3649 RepID=UPI000B8CD9AE|nr:L10-interacting MYB domain-containing protein-like isoform X1 [Carica papaya]